MAVGSGLDAQFGVGEESTVGTAVTVDHFNVITKDSLQYTQASVQGQGLRAGGLFDLATRYARTTKSVAGGVDLDVTTESMGLLFKHMLGSDPTPTQITPTTGTAYKQVHQPGTLAGYGLTLQKGVPQASDATVKAYTYKGAKVTEWTLACQVGGLLTLSLTFDAWDEDDATTLATASYTSTKPFHFDQATIKLGGTASTASSVVSVTSGVEATGLITGFELKGTNSLKTDRYFLGSSGVKAEQLENDFRQYALTLDGEFSKATLYDLFRDATGTAIQITFTGDNIETGNDYELDIILTKMIFNTGTNQVEGPDVVMTKLEGSAKDDATNAVMQLTYVSTDTAL